MASPRILGAIKSAIGSVGSLSAGDPVIAAELESFLVAFLSVTIVAEHETDIRSAFFERCERCGDADLTSMMKKSLQKRFWTPGVAKITDILGEFSDQARQAFKSAVHGTPSHAAWDNLLQARHDVVHGAQVPRLTLREIDDSYSKSLTVITEVRGALGL